MAYIVEKGTGNMSRDEWLENRTLGLGGSDCASALGLSPWKTPLVLWMEKTGRKALDDLSENETVHFGQVLEETVAQEFCLRTGKKVDKQSFIFKSVENPFMIADVDRIVLGENAGLECKTCSAYKADEWAEGKVPDYYKLQCFHYMAVMGWDRCYIACLIGGQHFVWACLDRDEEIIQQIIEAERNFWDNYVKADITPPVSNKEDCLTLYPDNNSDEYENPTFEDQEKAEEYTMLKSRIAKDTKRKEVLEDYFFKRSGDKKGISGICEFSMRKPSVSWKSLAENELTEDRITEIKTKYMGKPSKMLKIILK